MKKEESTYCAYHCRNMNVFLTGVINCGKSTTIDAFMYEYKGKMVGYKTIRYKTHLDDYHGIYLLDISYPHQKLSIDTKVGDCNKDQTLVCYKDVFEKLGEKALSNYKDADIVIMDELGTLENECYNFQKKVYECLDSDIDVLGVIKQRKSPFLDKIRNRKDVHIYNASMIDNRIILEELKDIFCK